MRARRLALAVGPLFALAPVPLRAVTCFSHSYGEAPFLCAYTFSRASLGGSDSTVNGVEYFDLVGGPADDTSAGHGGDSSASAPTTDTACAW